MRYPNHTTYEKLYARFINQENLKRMFDLVKDKMQFNGSMFFDICCGNGRASIEAAERGFGRFCLLDQESAMIPEDIKWRISKKTKNNLGFLEVYIYCEELNSFLKNRPKKFFSPFIWSKKKKLGYDLAMCEQAINYWASRGNFELLKEYIHPNGYLVFNTFNQQPPTKEKALIKNYNIGTDSYMEISWLDGEDVKHIQILNEEDSHFTKFKWLSKDKLKDLLNGIFNFEIFTFNKTDIYVCSPIIKKG